MFSKYKMGYNIEVSFNLYKHANITEMKNSVINVGIYCDCDKFYEDYDFELNLYNANVVITFLFSDIYYLIQFIKYVKNITGTYIESIYNENTNTILYASRFYQTKKMEKYQQKQYYQKKRSYSQDEIQLLTVVKPSLKNTLS